MLDVFLEVVSGQTKKAEAFDALVADYMKLPTEELVGIAAGTSKLAYGHEENWLKKFEGTPLYEDALALEQHCLEMDIEVQHASNESSELYQQRDAIGLKKRILDLELVNALQAEQSGGEEGPQEGPEHEAFEQQALEPSTGAGEPNPLGELKEAAARDLAMGALKRGKELVTGSRAKNLQSVGKSVKARGGDTSHLLRESVKETAKVRGTQAALAGAGVAGAAALAGNKKKEASATGKAFKVAVNKADKGGARALDLLSGAKADRLRGASNKAWNAGRREGFKSLEGDLGARKGLSSLSQKHLNLSGELHGAASSERNKVRTARTAVGGASALAGLAAAKKKKGEDKTASGVSPAVIEKMRKEAFGAALMQGAKALAPGVMQGLKGIAGGAKQMAGAVTKGVQRQGAAGGLHAAQGLGNHQIGQAAQWANKNRGAAAALGGGALGAAALAGRATGD